MKEVLIKNVLIHLLLIPFYLLTTKEVSTLPVDKLDTLLLFVGLIVIAPITSNFIYSYKNTINKKSLLWGHATTFLSMIVIGMLLATLDILLVFMIGNVLIFRITLGIFWLAVITFDFADFYTSKHSTPTASSPAKAS